MTNPTNSSSADPRRRSIIGRRLLHLGGAEFQIPAIESAKKLGCFVITADNRPENPGHRLSDLYENVSTIDFDAILDVARRHRIDGIMTFGSDVAVPTVSYVAEKLGLPGNALTAARILQRKDLFRTFQREHGIPHPDFRVTSSLDEALSAFDLLGGTVVIKASDSSGSKGMTVVENRAKVPDAFKHAKSFSRCGFVVLERFLKPDTLELDGDVLVIEGKLAFRHYGHNYFSKQNASHAPCGEIFPGFFGSEITEQLDRQFQKIIDILGIRTGCMNFDATVSEGIVYFFEIGLRNGGNYVPYLIQMSTGFDLTEAAVLSALGADVKCDRLYNPHPVPVASYILNSNVEGRFEGFDVSPAIEGMVTGSRLFQEVDSHVLPFTRGDRALGIVFLRFPDMETMNRVMSEIENHITLRVLPSNKVVRSSADGETRYEYVRYSELLSPFLRRKLSEAERRGDKTVERVIGRQFLETPAEKEVFSSENKKHYEADVGVSFEGVTLKGVERLYERVAVVEPLLQCAAHCRHCLRKCYEPFHLSADDLSRIARYIGRAEENVSLRELLVTGGDPFLIPDRLSHFLKEVGKEAPQIRVVRIASRLPLHQPDWVSEKLLSVLGAAYPFRVEVATQVNHAAEMFPETLEAFGRILRSVRTIYNQTVLLAGVNDTLDELVDLCCALRDAGIENHYIFHCVPIEGISAQRVSLDNMLSLVSRLSSCGRLSGRSKPKLCVMTDIGKVTIYEGVILKRDDNRYLMQTGYSLKDRMRWNPRWVKPSSAEVDENGLLRVWYTDAK